MSDEFHMEITTICFRILQSAFQELVFFIKIFGTCLISDFGYLQEWCQFSSDQMLRFCYFDNAFLGSFLAFSANQKIGKGVSVVIFLSITRTHLTEVEDKINLSIQI